VFAATCDLAPMIWFQQILTFLCFWLAQLHWNSKVLLFKFLGFLASSYCVYWECFAIYFIPIYVFSFLVLRSICLHWLLPFLRSQSIFCSLHFHMIYISHICVWQCEPVIVCVCFHCDSVDLDDMFSAFKL
jgi:hypothetical protein